MFNDFRITIRNRYIVVASPLTCRPATPIKAIKYYSAIISIYFNRSSNRGWLYRSLGNWRSSWLVNWREVNYTVNSFLRQWFRYIVSRQFVTNIPLRSIISSKYCIGIINWSSKIYSSICACRIYVCYYIVIASIGSSNSKLSILCYIPLSRNHMET